MEKQSKVLTIAAIVTLDQERVAGGAPIFHAQSREEQEKVSFLLGRLLDGMVHDLGNGCHIIVKY